MRISVLIELIQELGILQKAKAVAVVNWATNSKGNQLTDHVFRNSPKALHFIDAADIKKRRARISELIKKYFRNYKCPEYK